MCVERLLLPARAVEREDLLLSEALVERVLRDERLELREQRLVLAERKPGVGQELDGAEPELVEPRDCSAGDRLVREIGERRPPPEPKRPGEILPPPPGAAGAEGPLAGGGEPRGAGP